MKHRSPRRSGRRTGRRNRCFLAILAGTALVWFCLPAQAEELHRTAHELRAKYAAELGELAGWCEQRGLAEEARKTGSWLRPRDPNKLYLPVLPNQIGRPQVPADAPADVVEWDNRLTRLRRDQANALYELARRAIRSRRASLAFDLVLAALHENPDHDAIRRLLGYQSYRGQWRTAYEVGKLRTGQVWHEKFGWLPKSYVKRYEEGQRYFGGRWISAEEDARLHRDINSGWNVETEHYTIRTNHSIEAGVELGKRLEQLYGVWKQLFARFYLTESQVAALFAGGVRSRPAPLRRHAVVYFRNREDYHRSLRAAIPDIEISTGLYLEGMRRAYFFAGEDADVYHEATHQLFHESRQVARDVGRHRNFWIIEGVATYLETLRQENGYHVLGGFEGDRMQAARDRLLNDGFYVPLAEFTSYGMEDIKSDKRIATLYSQAAGLTHFLVHHDGGRYRDALVGYLTAVYSGRDDSGTLAQLTGASYSELDRQYRQFMEEGP